MYASPETTDILYVTEQSLDPQAARERVGLDLGIVTREPDIDTLREEVASTTARCVLIGDDVSHQRQVEIVRLLSESDSFPVSIVFSTNDAAGPTEELLEAGAADVVQSTLEAVPGALLQQRIDSVVGNLEVIDRAGSILDRYETLLNTAADAIYQLSADGRIVQVNHAAVELTGYSEGKLLDTHISAFLTEETLDEIASIRKEQLAGETDDLVSMELTILSADGERIPCDVRTKPIREQGAITGWVGVARDLRTQEKHEAELARTRELLSNAERLGEVGVWEVDLDSGELFWSDGARRIRGVDADFDPIVDDVLDFYHPADRERVSTLVRKCHENRTTFSTQARIITEAGEKRWVHLQGEPIESDTPRDVRGYIQDVTEQIEREQALQAERDLVEQVLEISPVGIITIEPSGSIVHVNDQAATIFGVPVDQLTGSQYLPDDIALFDDDGNPLEKERLPTTRILERGEEIRNRRFRITQPDGTERIISVDGVPLFEGEEIQRAILTVDDVTETVEREARLTDQRNELAQLDHINRTIRGVDQALLGATSRTEILEAVCEQLSASNRYRFALGFESIGDGEFDLRSWAGPAEQFVEEAFPLDDRSPNSCPGSRAVDENRREVIHDLANPASFDKAPWHQAAVDAGVRSMVALPITYEDQVYGIISVYAPFADFFSDRELAVLEELRETVGYAIAAVERREREQILTALYETTQDLLAAGTPREVTDAVVDTASDVLDAPGIGICLFDDEENVLRVESTTDELVEFYGGVTAFGPGTDDSATWQAYVTGETAFFRDVRESDHVADPETDARSTLLLPLGEHGVFVVSSDERGVFGEKRRQLIGLLAATTEAALDRVAGRANIRERDRELAARAARVDELEGSVALLRGVQNALADGTTRPEIEQGVCDQLVEREPYSIAWIGHVPPGTDSVEPSVWAGAEDAYLDSVSLEFGGEEPAVRAASTGEMVTIQDVTDHLQQTAWAPEAVNRDVQSVLAVPLRHGETSYGVLAVYATEPNSFDEGSRGILGQIAESTAYAIKMIETSQGLLAGQVTELELAVPDPETFLNAVAAVAGEAVTYREITPQPDGSAQVLFSLTDAPVEEILALEEEFVSVRSLRAVERGDEVLFRAALSGQTVAATLLDCGGIPSEVIATPTETTAVVRLSQEIDVRVFIDRVTQQFPGTELRSRRSVEDTVQSTSELRAIIDEKLTDRQREVLFTAYESGFFESPRDTTGEQLASLLDLSQPTVTHHLREAQRRLYEALFDDEEQLSR